MTEKILHKNLFILFLLLISSFLQAKMSLPGFQISKDQIRISSLMFHDGVWHVSLAEAVKKEILPEQPGFAGEKLGNYHYFLDIFIAYLSKWTGLPSFEIYFNILPFIFAFFYGLTGYLAIKKLTGHCLWSVVGVFFLYFSGNLSFLLPWIRKGGWGENSFMLNQPIAFSQNLALLLSMSFFFIFILVFERWFLASLVLGFMFGLKAHTALPLFLGLILAGGLDFWFNRKLRLLKTAAPTLIIAAIILFKISRPFGSLIFIPGWLLSRMIADPDRVNLANLALKESFLRERSAFLGLFHLQLSLFLIYLLGNLGIRILGFWEGIKQLIKRKFSPLLVFLAISGFISLLIPILFNQRGSAYDIVQFGEVSLVIFTLLTVIFLQKKLKGLSFEKQIITFLFLLILALPVSVKTVWGYFHQGYSLIDKEEKEGIEFLKSNLSGEDVILLHPLEKTFHSHYLQALSGKRVFYADQKTAVITGKNYQPREQFIKSFFGLTSQEPDCGWLKRYNIKYLYLLTQEQVYFKCHLEAERVFGNEKVSIYWIDSASSAE